MKCPVCSSSDTSPFLERSNVPALQNLVLDSEKEALVFPRGDMKLALCAECGFIQNSAFDPKLFPYGPQYDNNQAFSSFFLTHLESQAKHLVEAKGLKNQKVVEIGCGQGNFLRKVCELGNNMGIGFDPAYRGPEQELNGRIRYERKLYGPDCADIPTDAVVCRHVIEHVLDPVALLTNVREALKGSPDARIYFETPDVEWIFSNGVFWDLFYEHCNYFSKESVARTFEAAGFRVVEIRPVFQDQYLWIEAVVGRDPKRTSQPPSVHGLARRYAQLEAVLLSDWREKLKALRNAGRVAVWGAGAKGVTFVNVVDPKRGWIDCVVDLNPTKQGRFIPGTGHSVLSYRDLPARGVTSAILMNPNYRAENEALLRDARISLELIDQRDQSLLVG